VDQFSTQNVRRWVPHPQFLYKYLFTLQIMYTALFLSPLGKMLVIMDQLTSKNRDTINFLINMSTITFTRQMEVHFPAVSLNIVCAF